MTDTPRPPIVLIHGMFMTATCWDGWADRLRAAGHEVHAPSWPGRDRPVADLRAAHPDPALGQLRLADVIAHFDAFVRALPVPPVLIGHSMGGLVVQALLARGLGAKGVAIHSAAPFGVFVVSLPFVQANWAVINPFIRASTPYLMTPAEFAFGWVHVLEPAAQQAAYDRHLVPESRQVGRDSLTFKVDFAAKKAPLLFVAGGDDHTIPGSLNKANHRKYASNPSETSLQEYPGRSHFTLGQPGWEAVADAVAAWVAA
jgi:pimeloyl-ACP methyl ester carboxylesterase